MEVLKVVSIAVDGPASKAGIKVGDFIASVDNGPARTQLEFDEAVKLHKRVSFGMGRTYPVTLLRGGDKLAVSINHGPHGMVCEPHVCDAVGDRRARLEALAATLPKTFSALFESHMYSHLNLNVVDPLVFVKCNLVGVAEEYFSVLKDKSIVVVPYATILQVWMPQSGGDLSVSVRHEVIYKDRGYSGSSVGIGVGVGISIPLD